MCAFLFSVASHVILRTVKAVPEYGKRKKSRHSTPGGEGGEDNSPPQATSDENDNKVEKPFEIRFVMFS